MYKVVIIDDEPIIRRGLIKSVKWQQYNCHVVGEADDGLDGLTIIREHLPHIIFTDITMHEMDGLTMISQIKRVVPFAKIVILTGYRDFEFAQTAVTLGVKRYLLKPCRMPEIDKVVQDMVNELDNELTTKNIEVIITYYASLLEHVQQGDTEKAMDDIQLIKKSTISTKHIGNDLRGVYWNTISTLSEFNQQLSTNKRSEATNHGQLKKLLDECEDIDSLNFLLEKSALSFADKVDDLYNCNIDYKIRTVIRFIHENFDKPISLADVATHIHVSEPYACKLFRKEIGKTFIDYLNELRIEKAKKLLKDTQYKIYEVAEKVCIPDAQYFSRLFKKCVGVSPKEFVSTQNIEE